MSSQLANAIPIDLVARIAAEHSWRLRRMEWVTSMMSMGHRLKSTGLRADLHMETTATTTFRYSVIALTAIKTITTCVPILSSPNILPCFVTPLDLCMSLSGYAVAGVSNFPRGHQPYFFGLHFPTESLQRAALVEYNHCHVKMVVDFISYAGQTCLYVGTELGANLIDLSIMCNAFVAFV